MGVDLEHVVKPSGDAEYYTFTRPEMMAFVPSTAQRVLELGCAEGDFANQLKRHTGAEVWGIEFNPTAAEQASKVIDHVLVGDAEERIGQLPDDYFDVIVCNDVLEHLVDPNSVLKMLKRTMKSDAVVIASIPNIRHFPALAQIVFRKDFPQREIGIFDRTHLRFFTRKSIIRMFEEAGYAVQKIKGINGYCGPLGYLLIAVSLGYFADSFYLQYACVATPRN
jgi:2-polyprenyl-3-methyl-5-hydroxy-6-metoxy-1,4-benzoquinol methylase